MAEEARVRREDAPGQAIKISKTDRVKKEQAAKAIEGMELVTLYELVQAVKEIKGEGFAFSFEQKNHEERRGER